MSIGNYVKFNLNFLKLSFFSLGVAHGFSSIIIF